MSGTVALKYSNGRTGTASYSCVKNWDVSAIVVIYSVPLVTSWPPVTGPPNVHHQNLKKPTNQEGITALTLNHSSRQRSSNRPLFHLVFNRRLSLNDEQRQVAKEFSFLRRSFTVLKKGVHSHSSQMNEEGAKLERNSAAGSIMQNYAQ